MLRFTSVLSFTLLVLAAAFGRQQKLTRQPSMKPPSLHRTSGQKSPLRDVPSKASQEADLCCNETQKSLTAVKLANEILIVLAKDLQAKLKSSCPRPTSKNATCPTGFTYLPSAEKCYIAEYEALDWSSAGKKCQQLRRGANLAVIESRREHDAVKAFLVSQPSSESTFWTSGQLLNETCRKSSFVWKPSSGKRLALTFDAWVVGEPSCNEGKELCLNLWRLYGFDWNDYNCDYKTGSLCEYKP